jgi:hypothetical protein|tara:strand:+ start:551 stop:835 length:285 start_codon:yes stop_codon:yes gene_type:complete
MDFQAIRRAYPNVCTMQDEGNQILDADNKPIVVEQSKIDAARAEIDAEYVKNEYQRKRAEEYPNLVDQLDDIYHNGIDGWKATIKATKDKYPKS